MTIPASANLAEIANGKVPDATKVNGELAWIESQAANAGAAAGDTIQGPFNYGITAGTAAAYTLTLNPALTAYRDGQVVRFRAHLANDNNPSLNVSGLGARTIYDANGSGLAPGMLGANYQYVVIYSSTFSGWFLVSTPQIIQLHELLRATVTATNATPVSLSTVAAVLCETTTMNVRAGDIVLVQVMVQARKLTTQGNIIIGVIPVGTATAEVTANWLSIGSAQYDIPVGSYRSWPLFAMMKVKTSGTLGISITGVTSVADGDVATNEAQTSVRVLANG